MDMNFYTKEYLKDKSFNDLVGQKYFETEVGKVSDGEIWNRIFKVSDEKYEGVFKELAQRVGIVKTMDMDKYFLSWLFFPSLTQNKRRLIEWGEYFIVLYEIINNTFNSYVERGVNKKAVIRYLDLYTKNSHSYFVGDNYTTGEDGKYYHRFDRRVEKYPRDGFNEDYFNGNEAEALAGIKNCIESDKIEDRAKTEIIDWYIKRGNILNYSGKMKAKLCQMLLIFSARPEANKVTREIYRRHSGDFDKIFDKNPELNFYDLGSYIEYESVEAFIEAAGYEIKDFFKETSEPDESAGSSGSKSAHTKRIPLKTFAISVLNALRSVHMGVESKDARIINFRPEQEEPRKALVFGQYVGVSFREGGEWWILVDSIKSGNAIYLWHGLEYQDGLDVFCSSKAYARGSKDVEHKNHRIEKTTLETYRSMLKAHNIVI